MRVHNHRWCQRWYIYMWTSPSLSLPINCNHDQGLRLPTLNKFQSSFFLYVKPSLPIRSLHDLSCFFSILTLLLMARGKVLQLRHSLIYGSRDRIHRGWHKAKLKTKTLRLYSTRKKRKLKRKTKTKVKAKDVMVIRYRGNSPKLGTSQGDCPYQCS